MGGGLGAPSPRASPTAHGARRGQEERATPESTAVGGERGKGGTGPGQRAGDPWKSTRRWWPPKRKGWADGREAPFASFVDTS
jgi:hypothetical protein